jgi:hypothetical protein
MKLFMAIKSDGQRAPPWEMRIIYAVMSHDWTREWGLSGSVLLAFAERMSNLSGLLRDCVTTNFGQNADNLEWEQKPMFLQLFVEEHEDEGYKVNEGYKALPQQPSCEIDVRFASADFVADLTFFLGRMGGFHLPSFPGMQCAVGSTLRSFARLRRKSSPVVAKGPCIFAAPPLLKMTLAV